MSNEELYLTVAVTVAHLPGPWPPCDALVGAPVGNSLGTLVLIGDSVGASVKIGLLVDMMPLLHPYLIFLILLAAHARHASFDVALSMRAIPSIRIGVWNTVLNVKIPRGSFRAAVILEKRMGEVEYAFDCHIMNGTTSSLTIQHPINSHVPSSAAICRRKATTVKMPKSNPRIVQESFMVVGCLQRGTMRETLTLGLCFCSRARFFNK